MTLYVHASASNGAATSGLATCRESHTSLEASELERPLDFEQLVRRCLGRIDLADRLLASFEGRFPAELAQIEQCLVEGDSVRLARLVHQSKGATANVSAPALYAIMAKMEHAAQARHLDDVGAYLALAYGAWDRFCEYKHAVRADASHQVGEQRS